ncbi:helix-turn-helix domain-containing protein [Lacticaseibacillus sp. N501-2]|uniref:helix-turn-helix domain-containing protein n=1 Tax=Lacticaseibacillus salsurae TaxID=3367729 RepID=UPI0038B3185B
MKIGEKLVAGRQKQGFTQQEVADKLFVTRQTVSQWEHDQRKPDLENVARLCRLLKLDARDLLEVNDRHSDTMIELLGVPAFANISRAIATHPAYMHAVVAGKQYPHNSTPKWLHRLTAGYQMAVGQAEFGDIVTLKDEHGQVFYAKMPKRVTIALLQSVIFPSIGLVPLPQTRYRTLVTIDHMHVLIPTPTVVPALFDWAKTYQVVVQDPMQLAAHRQSLDFKALTQTQFDKLAAGTPYAIIYQQSGGNMAPW